MDQNTLGDLRKTLLGKLKGGNKRYPHLNATIGRSVSKVDLLDLNEIKEGFANEFLEKLFGEINFHFAIPLKDIDKEILKFTNTKRESEAESEDSKEALEKLKVLGGIKKKFGFLEAHQKEENSEFGTRSFAFGYPLLVKQFEADREDTICAPLFIWYLDISRDYQTNSIVISRNEDSPIYFNEMLDYYLESNLNLDFSQVVQSFSDEVFNDGIMDKDEIKTCADRITNKISSTLRFDLDTSNLTKVPNNKKEVAALLEKENDAETIINAGIFGVFRAGKQSIIADLKNLIALEEPGIIEDEVVVENEITHVAIEMDPTQNSVIEATNESNNIIVQGPPGTGKSQTLTALITNALTNSQRTLVVCEKRTAMEIIASNLNDCGLGQYVALIENVSKDRTAIVDRARTINESRNRPNYRVSDELSAAITAYSNAALDVSHHHSSIAATEAKGLGQNKDILGNYLKEIKIIDKDSYSLIKEELSRVPFAYTSAEFNAVLESFNNIRDQYIGLQELRYLPKEEVTRNNDFVTDKKQLTDYLSAVGQKLEVLRGQVEGYHSRLVEKYIQKIKDQHELARETAKKALKNLSIAKHGFNWEYLYKDLEGVVFPGYSKGEPTNIIKKLSGAQDEINTFRAALGTKYSEIDTASSELKSLALEIVQHIKLLRDLGVENYQHEAADSIKAIFGSRQKNIKISKDRISNDVKRINSLLQSYSYILGIDSIIVNPQLENDLKRLVTNLPAKSDTERFFDTQQVGSIVEVKDQKISTWTVIEYVDSLLEEQFDQYLKLKFYLWRYYRGLIKSQLTPYLAEELEFESVDENLGDSTSLSLERLVSSSPDKTNLDIKASEVADELTTKTPGVEEVKAKLESILSEQPYSKLFTEQHSELSESSSLGALRNLLAQCPATLSRIGAEIEKDFYPYHSWCSTLRNLGEIPQKVIEVFERLKLPQSDWDKFFKGVYFELAFVVSCTSDNLKNEIPIEQMLLGDSKIKKLVVDNIHAKWGAERLMRIGSFESGILKFNTLYNKRGSAGQRRNSLRKIIDKDFSLFTALFPVVICNPSSSASLLKLEKNLFDVVLFDEASQLRLEDTYTSLYRGRRKIISGDRHQMPPSDYFQSVAGEEDIDYNDDESMQIQEMANSESLLDYGQVNSYRASMLKVHYRSSHEDLINFSNAAFYGGKLIPIPSLADYRAIDFHRVDGTYSDRTNQQEADFIIQWLIDYINDGSFEKSVGIVTLNLPQSELIKEKISDKRTEDTVFNSGMSKLEENGLFIKNLENVQGDERDIMLLSTTFGPDGDGKFIQNFGPLNRKNGYRLLNVLTTRAKDRFIVICSIPDRNIDQYQEELVVTGNDRRAIFYAYLAYARAVGKGDNDEKTHILSLLAERSSEVGSSSYQNIDNTESPFEEEVLAKLETVIDRNRIVLQFEVGSEKFRIDMVILDKAKNHPVLAIECDGYAYHSSPDACLYDIYRQKILERKGFKFYRIWSSNWFYDADNESQKLIRKIQEVDAMDGATELEPVFQ